MAELEDAVPKDLFISRFKTVKEKVLATHWKGFQRARAKDVPSVCMFIWDEMVHRGKVTEPFSIAPIINNGYKGIANFVEKKLQAVPVSEAYAVSYYNEIDPENSFVDVSLVRCFPNDIHIADVEFSDNQKPAHAGEIVKNAAERNYHGLHVFGDFIDRLNVVARAKGVSRLSLMVAHPDLYPVFSRHGFQVNDTHMARMAFERAGMGFSMTRMVV